MTAPLKAEVLFVESGRLFLFTVEHEETAVPFREQEALIYETVSVIA